MHTRLTSHSVNVQNSNIVIGVNGNVQQHVVMEQVDNIKWSKMSVKNDAIMMTPRAHGRKYEDKKSVKCAQIIFRKRHGDLGSTEMAFWSY